MGKSPKRSKHDFFTPKKQIVSLLSDDSEEDSDEDFKVVAKRTVSRARSVKKKSSVKKNAVSQLPFSFTTPKNKSTPHSKSTVKPKTTSKSTTKSTTSRSTSNKKNNPNTPKPKWTPDTSWGGSVDTRLYKVFHAQPTTSSTLKSIVLAKHKNTHRLYVQSAFETERLPGTGSYALDGVRRQGFSHKEVGDGIKVSFILNCCYIILCASYGFLMCEIKGETTYSEFIHNHKLIPTTVPRPSTHRQS